MDHKEELTTFIRQEILHGRAVPLGEEDDLLGAGVKVPDEDVVFENFQSIGAMARYVTQRKQETDPAAV